jgi:hypothetical protein
MAMLFALSPIPFVRLIRRVIGVFTPAVLTVSSPLTVIYIAVHVEVHSLAVLLAILQRAFISLT